MSTPELEYVGGGAALLGAAGYLAKGPAGGVAGVVIGAALGYVVDKAAAGLGGLFSGIGGLEKDLFGGITGLEKDVANFENEVGSFANQIAGLPGAIGKAAYRSSTVPVTKVFTQQQKAVASYTSKVLSSPSLQAKIAQDTGTTQSGVVSRESYANAISSFLSTQTRILPQEFGR